MSSVVYDVTVNGRQLDAGQIPTLFMDFSMELMTDRGYRVTLGVYSERQLSVVVSNKDASVLNSSNFFGGRGGHSRGELNWLH